MCDPTNSARQKGIFKTVDVQMEEYKSLRQESLLAISNMYKIIVLSTTSLSLILAGLLTGKIFQELKWVEVVIELLVLPCVSNFVVLIWLNEFHRSRRVGYWLRKIENEVNYKLDGQALWWEHWLTLGQKRKGYGYKWMLALMLVPGTLSLLFGIYRLTCLLLSISKYTKYWWVVLAVCLVVIVLGKIEYSFFRWVRKEMNEIGKEYGTYNP